MQNEKCRIQNAEHPSAFCNLQSAICNLLLVLLPAVSQAQGFGPVTFRDSLVMRQMIYRAPCPIPVPPAWSSVDSMLGRPPGCAIVETAARAIGEYLRVRPPMQAMDPWKPLCARVVVARNTGSTGLPGDWMVIMDLTLDNTARVVIDRQSGAVGGVSMSHGLPDDRMPRCIER